MRLILEQPYVAPNVEWCKTNNYYGVKQILVLGYLQSYNHMSSIINNHGY